MRYDREILPGFIAPASYLQPTGVELLTPGGAVLSVPYPQIKAVCFVKDWDGPPVFAERRQFAGRPRSPGLWIEAVFRDGDLLQGVIANDLLQMEEHGVSFVPPEVTGNTQRLFVPRAALSGLTVLGVVASPLRQPRAKPASPEQIQLFTED